MTEKAKKRLALLFLLSASVFPFVVLVTSWAGWDGQIGGIAALATSALFFLLGCISLLSVQDMSWPTVSLPFLAGTLHAILPNSIVGPFDDAAAAVAGAVLAFVLARKKEPGIPQWVLTPLLTAGLYTLIGGAIPGTIDEYLVSAIGLGITSYGVRRQLASSSDLDP